MSSSLTIGLPEPTQAQKALLAKIGFDCATIKVHDRSCTIEIPEEKKLDGSQASANSLASSEPRPLPKLRIIATHPDFDKIDTMIYYNGMEVGSVWEKTATWDPKVHLHLNAQAIDKAVTCSPFDLEKVELKDYPLKLYENLEQLRLCQSDKQFHRCIPYLLESLAQLSTENVVEYENFFNNDQIKHRIEYKKLRWPPIVKAVRSDYEKKIDDRIAQLKFCASPSGASAGYGGNIPIQLELMQQIRNEDPTAHDAYIKSVPEHSNLFALFPNWIDENHLTQKYRAADQGPLMAVASAGQGCILA